MQTLRALLHFKTFVFLTAVVLFVVVAGIAVTLKYTVDYLLYWDATASAESWA